MEGGTDWKVYEETMRGDGNICYLDYRDGFKGAYESYNQSNGTFWNMTSLLCFSYSLTKLVKSIND